MRAAPRPLPFLLTLLLALGLAGCVSTASVKETASLDDVTISQFRTETPWVEINGNVPGFTEEDMTTEAFETYSELDALGRCGTAYANLCQELMPTEPRGEIGQIKPTGWQTVRYEGIDGDYLYNRCHLIGFQLAGENANERNLITGTRFMNTQGMLPFENQVADYIDTTDHHVLYRVTPLYNGSDLVAWGVEMEAYSVEDNGAGICFHVLCFNAQPAVAIDYATGASWRDDTVGTGQASGGTTESQTEDGAYTTYILNTASHRFHTPDCSGAAKISEANRQEVTTTRQALIDQGYTPCGTCKP